MKAILIEVSFGELIDKITILELKCKFFTDVEQLNNVNFELRQLINIFEESSQISERILELMERLRLINYELWQLEKVVRHCANNSDFGSEFIQAARSIYSNNDARHSIKKSINELVGSRITDEKNYSVGN